MSAPTGPQATGEELGKQERSVTATALPTAPRLQSTCAGGGGAAGNKGGAHTWRCGGPLTLNPGAPLGATHLTERACTSVLGPWAATQTLRARRPPDLGRRQARFPDRSAGGHY